jgi:hypothetical protein
MAALSPAVETSSLGWKAEVFPHIKRQNRARQITGVAVLCFGL